MLWGGFGLFDGRHNLNYSCFYSRHIVQNLIHQLRSQGFCFRLSNDLFIRIAF
jgi:hypothetical protein